MTQSPSSETEQPGRSAIEKALGSRILFDAVPMGIYCCDTDGIIRLFNRRAAELWGRTPESGESDERFCGAQCVYLPDGRRLARTDTPMAEVLRTAKPCHNREVVIERPDGTIVTTLVNIDPVFDTNGTFIGAINCFQDVSERHAAALESAYLAAIVASSSDAIVGKTLDGTVTSWNAGATQIFGYTAEEMIGQSITRIIPEELHEQESEILARLGRGERIEHFDTIRLAKDGRRIHVSLTVSPIRDSTGRIIGASKVGRDVTERKRAEELQQLLIGELNHRVKNTLATVQSIADQTVRHCVDPQDFVNGFIGRIQALAQTHDVLTQNVWQGADLARIVDNEVLLVGASDHCVTVSGPSVSLAPQPALHLTLVLHELATNARKHGALSVPEGRVSVTWTVRQQSGGRTLNLRWAEADGPDVQAPVSRGFGTTLIEKSLAAHGGRATIDYGAEGVSCNITLPLQDAEGTETAMLSRGMRAEDDDFPVTSGKLLGRRVLVVEDEPLIAMDVSDVLSEAGCSIVGPATNLDEAIYLAASESLDAAILDANLAGQRVDSLAATLDRRDIPFAFLTGYGREGLPEQFRQSPLINKPFLHAKLIETVHQLTARNATVVQLRRKRSSRSS